MVSTKSEGLLTGWFLMGFHSLKRFKLVALLIYTVNNIKSGSAMSTATEPARPRCFPPGDVMHESA